MFRNNMKILVNKEEVFRSSGNKVAIAATTSGYTYKRKIDNFIMGNELYLGLFIDGTDDVIDNYEEVVDDSPKE